MPNYLHRTTKEYLVSVSPINLPEPEANYIVMPDLSAVVGVSSTYWKITGDVVSEMSAAEKASVDAALLEARRDSETAPLDAPNTPDLLRALALVVRDEVNSLRAKHGLAARTVAQLKAALRSKM